MKDKEELKTYLKRTRRLLRFWDREVPKRKVELSEVSNNSKGKYSYWPHTIEQLKDCGSVGCVAGWAFALALRDKEEVNINESRIVQMQKYYGLTYQGYLFDVRQNEKISQWREARMRIEKRINELQAQIKEAS